MVRKRAQTGLPPDVTEAATRGVGFSTGLATSNYKNFVSTPQQPLNRNPTLIRNPPHRFSSSSLPVTAVSSVVASANPLRRFLMIQNVGTNTVFLGFNIQATLNGVELNPGFEISWADGIVPNNAIEAFSVVGSTVTVLEGTEFS